MKLALVRAGGAALILASFGTAPALAQQDYLKDLTDLVGLTSPEVPDINYRERAPLVVPPNEKLTQPVGAGQPADPRWPLDPDEVARKKAADNARVPATIAARNRADLRDRPALTPAERRALGRSDTPGAADNQPRIAKGDSSREEWIHPDTLRSFRALDPEQPKLAPGVEPPRRALTDPPKGLRLPAGNAPLVATRDKREDALEPNAREYQRSLQRQ